MTGRVSRSLSKVFWEVIAAGWSVERAAGLCGVSKRQGYRWFSDAGGMAPLCLARPSSARHLRFDDRLGIYVGLMLGNSYSQIAKGLGRADVDGAP